MNFKEGYESPINLESRLCSEIIENEENEIVGRIKNILHIDIDKERLIEAINYDSKQYNKGYQNGFNSGFNKGYNDAIKKIKLKKECDKAYKDGYKAAKEEFKEALRALK